MSETAPETESWAVIVERNGEQVVTIASRCLAGRDLTPEDERVIRMAAQYLESFVGPAPTNESDYMALRRVEPFTSCPKCYIQDEQWVACERHQASLQA